MSWAEFWYNTTFHASTKITPFRAVYDRDPPLLIRATLDELKYHLPQAQAKIKLATDGHRRDVQFEVGDSVYLKLGQYRLRSLACKLNEKLSPQFFGPFQVIQCIGPVAYKLELPSSTSIHLVFHISHLKRALGATERNQPLPPLSDSELEWLTVLESVLDIRTTALGTKVLIQWKGLPPFEATWESTEMIQRQCPAFHLEDKVTLTPRG